MNLEAGNVFKGFFGKLGEVGKHKLPFVKGTERAREAEGERTALFDGRYGWVNNLGESSRFDGAGSLRGDSVVSINEGGGRIHRDDCGGYCGSGLVRKRSM